VTVTFEELQQFARMLLEKPLSFSLDDFVKKVEEWVQSQPEPLRDSFIGYFGSGGSKVVRRRELPQALREDPDFRERFIKFLAGR